VKAPPDQAIRDRVRTDFATTLVLEAGAGTGKTTVLVDRLVNLVVTGTATLDRVVAVTFTEAAAGELKMRLRDALEERLGIASPDEAVRVSRAVVDLERANISTIHAFAAAVLRERPFEAGIDPSFGVIADIAGERTFDDAWTKWIEETVTAGDEVMMRAVHLGLKIGDFQQAARQVVADRDVLGLPVPLEPFDPATLLSELKRELGPLQRQKRHCRDESDGAYLMIEELDERLRQATRLKGAALEVFLRRLNITAHKGSQSNWETKTICVDVKATLKRLKETVEAWVERSDANVNSALRGRLLDFLQRYETRKAEGALADFQDLLLRARAVLAESVPVRRYFQAKFDRILVDEFQDTDPLQAELVAFLAEDPSTAPASDWRRVQLLPGKLFIVGDPKQSIYRFRRADLQVYEDVKSLVTRCGGAVLPLTANFRTVPSVIGFVNDRFWQIFAEPGDPQPIPLEPYRDEVDPEGARAVALTVPAERMPQDTRLEPRRSVVAETIAAFIDDIIRVEPWIVYDAQTRRTRPARPGDVAILVRKMTPDFVSPFEDALRARQLSYRLAGGKEYFVRDEVLGLAAVLRAIDNPADRLSLVQALRSPFFATSDADLFHFVATGGVLNINAPQAEGVAKRDVFDAIFSLLARLHRLRRIESPSAIIEELFARTRALSAFLTKPSGAQMVANLWKVLETARAYEAPAPTTLRAFVRFLQAEEASGRGEGDSPVGEAVGASVEIVTVHKAKGLEYPIVIVADLFTEKLPASNCIIDHAGMRGWIKIGQFKPEKWKEKSEAEALQQEAEGRRLLYVALTRARDHLVIPCLPGERVQSWLGPVANALVRPVEDIPFGKRDANVTWYDSRRLVFGVEGPRTHNVSVAVDGSASDAKNALAAEQAWIAARRATRKQARVPVPRISNPSDSEPARPRGPSFSRDAADADQEAGTGAQRLYGSEPAGELSELSHAEGIAASVDDEPAVLGRYVHEIMATVDLSGNDVEPIARTLARRYGVADMNVKRALEMVRRVLDLPLMHEARAATKIYREVPLIGNASGGRAEGKIDLLFEREGKWWIVEFKTDALDGSDALREYGGQLRAYSTSLAGVVAADVKAVICLVQRAEVVAP
jgi:ATP-dependent exoDNAse (exonuclease V) beta subunit